MRSSLSLRRPGAPLAVACLGLLPALASAQQPVFADICQPLSNPFAAQRLTTGDIQGDGVSDVALVILLGAQVWEGTAEGLSPTPTLLPTPVTLRTGALADLDDDGLADLVLLAQTEPFALVAWSQGNGSFSGFQVVTLPSRGGAVAVGDVTGDGRADLLASHFGFPRIAIVPGLGDHQFAPSYDISAASDTNMLELGDIDADGALDILSRHFIDLFTPAISTSLGDGAGHFTPPAQLVEGMSVAMALFADANLDGLDDVLLVTGGSLLQLFVGQANGSLAPPVLVANVPGLNEIAVGDVTGDGLPDLLAAAKLANTTRVMLLRQTGAGFVLDPAATAYAYDSLANLAAADVDGDGLADAVSREAISESLAALIAQQGGGFRNGAIADAPQRDALVLDLDGDGHPDLLTALSAAPTGRVRAGQPNGAFGPLASVDLGSSPRRLFAGDAELDGDLDVLVVQDTGDAGAHWVANDGDGSLVPLATTFIPGGFRCADAGDLDSDGLTDVVIGTLTTPAVTPLLTGAGPALVAQPAIPMSSAPNALAVGDFDGTGWLDVALTIGVSVQVLRLQPAGDPLVTTLLTGGPGQDVVLGNFDGDGRADVLVSTQQSLDSGLAWVENDGSGTPVTVGIFPLQAGFFTGPLGLGDADGDGFGELLLGGTSGQFNLMCAVLHSQGGPPTVDELHPLTSAPARCRLADADGDGALDLVVLGEQEGPVLVLPSSAPTWQRLGHSLAGGAGLSRLECTGPLVAGTPVGLRVEGALPSAAAILVVGLSVLDAPFKGGVMVPDTDWLLTGPLTDADGALTIAGDFPAGVPSGTTIAAQVWMADFAGPVGFSATWGVSATSP